ncbi:MAG: amidohydrolase family protein [Chloroflexi bacterium]|nr:amidohydrolase family protein [Chloroflexota bacterium]
MRATRNAPNVEALKLLDTCVTLGRMSYGGPSLTAETVLSVMDKHDIAEALVHNNEARTVLPRSRGNRRLLEWIDGMERLHPVWVLNPPPTPDPRNAWAMVEEMLDAGVRVARLMMGVAPPLLWLWDDLCTALEAHRVPCLLDFAATQDYFGRSASTQSNPDDAAMDGLREICLAHPKLQMILSHVSGGLGVAYSTLPMMYRVPNLHLDITNIVDYWRRVVATMGPERVFFATGMPFYDPAIFVSNVQYARDLDVTAKRQICGDNMRRLMEGVR